MAILVENLSYLPVVASLSPSFLRLIERSIRFELFGGADTWVAAPHATGWRVLPYLVAAQVDYASRIERKGLDPLRLGAGGTVVIAPGVVHNLTMTSRQPGYSHWCHLQCEVFHGVSLFYLIAPPLRITGPRSQKLSGLIQALTRTLTGASSLNSFLQKQAAGWNLIVALLEAQPLDASRVQFAHDVSRLTPVLAYIEENLAQPVTHDLLARVTHLSPSRFHVLFKTALGCAPYEYVQRLRLEKAQQLLLRSDQSVSEIGAAVGHPDPYHFSRVFRRSVGLSPAKYRRQAALNSF